MGYKSLNSKKNTPGKSPKKGKSTPGKSPEEVHLLKLIEISKKAVTDQGTPIDIFFLEQTSRLEEQLTNLRNK